MPPYPLFIMKSSFNPNVTSIDISGIRRIFEASGSGAINLGLGQPDLPTPRHVIDAAKAALDAGMTGYTKGPGIPELTSAVAEKFRRENGLEYDQSQIMATSGASEALLLSILSTCTPADELLVPDPGFVSYESIGRMVGARVVGVPLGENLTVEPDTVSELLNGRTRALILNSPSNPTGTVQTKDEIRGLAELADDHGFTLITDEVYEHFVYSGEHHSAAKFGHNVITINAVSKTYSMTGFRLGYLAAPTEHIEQLHKVHQYVQACAPSISQAAAVAALNGPQDSVAAMREEFRARRDLLMRGLDELGWPCVMPMGAFYAFPKVENADDAVNTLLENKVVTVPGNSFGGRGEGYIRISYATSQDNIKRALDIMREVL